MSFSTPPLPVRARPRPHAGRRRARLVAALLACASAAPLVAPRPAWAQPTASDAERALELNESGSALYAAGDFAGALSAFERAYALVAETNLLFNIAGCHERLGHRTQAVEYYRWFLGSPDANPDGRRRAIAGLSRLEPKSELPPAPAPEADPGTSSATVWSLATLGAGIVFAGLGAALYLDGAHDHNEVTGAPGYGEITGSSLSEVEAQDLIDSGDTKKLLGAIGFGVGGALITTHVVISIWQASESDAQASSAEFRLLPNGWAVTGRF